MVEKPRTKEELLGSLEQTARRLRRLRLLLALVSLVVGAGYLAVMVAWGSVRLRGFVGEHGPWGLVFWYLLFFTLIYNLVHFPVSFLRGWVLPRRFGLSRRTFGRWLLSEIKKYLVSTALVVLLGEFLYVFLRRWEATWWFWTWLLYLVFGLVISRYGSRVILPLFYKREPLDDDPLKERLASLVARAGFKAKSVTRIVLSKDTRRANAAVAGLGASKEILVSDTLLGILAPEEIEAVVAHELADAKRLHSEIILIAGAVISFLGFFLAAAVLGASSDAMGLLKISDVAGFPLVVLVLAGLYLVMTPAINYLSRELERAADLWAARFTGAGETLATALEKLAANNLTEKSQPKYFELLFSSHPSIAARVAYLRKPAPRE